MKHIAPAVFALLLLAVPAAAQNRSFDLTGNFVWLDATGAGEFEDLAEPAEIDIEADAGYGLAANIFFGERLSAEFAVARVEAETNVTRRRAVAASGPGGTLTYMPVTAVLQWHFAPNGFIDPYIGGGAAYLIYDFSESQGVHGIDEIDFDDDLGLAVNAGIGIRMGERFGINIDGKYVPVESNARAVILTPSEESEGRVDVSPIIISAGVSLRF
jgi:outer membrane protein